MKKRRSGWHAGMQIDWVGDLAQARTHRPGQGVGARQAERPTRRRGGGYLDECSGLDLWEGARIRELADMGLPSFWIAVAREIGYSNFMAMWRILDGAVETRSESESMIEVQLRRFASFKRYQRNRFIEALANVGLDEREIQGRVKGDLGEELSLSHIYRLARRRRVTA